MLLVCVRHLDEGRGNRTTRGGMLSEQTVGTDSLIALNEAGKRPSIAFDEPGIHQFFTAPFVVGRYYFMRIVCWKF